MGRDDMSKGETALLSNLGNQVPERLQEVVRDQADADQRRARLLPRVELEKKGSALVDEVNDNNAHKQKLSPDGIDPDTPTARTKLSIKKWRRAKKSESGRLKPSTEVIEIYRVAVHSQDEWTISNLEAVCLWDERGIKAAASALAYFR